MYETVVQKMMTIDESSLKPSCGKIPTNLDVVETMEILSSGENRDPAGPVTLVEEGKKRLISLITKSTAEKNFIPLDVAKIFS